MKKLFTRVAPAALAAALVVTLAAAQDAKKPVNKMCPVMMDHKVDVEVTVTYKGKIIGLCCTDCVKKWNGNPGAFAGNIKEDFGTPDLPESAPSLAGAIESGKGGGYLTAVLFVDKTPKTEAFVKLLLDAAVNPEIHGCAFAKVEYRKDAEDAKKYKVTAAPTLLLIDPTKDPAVVLKTITTGTPKTLLKDLQEAKEKLGK